MVDHLLPVPIPKRATASEDPPGVSHPQGSRGRHPRLAEEPHVPAAEHYEHPLQDPLGQMDRRLSQARDADSDSLPRGV